MTEQNTPCPQYNNSNFRQGPALRIMRFCSIRASMVEKNYAIKCCETSSFKDCYYLKNNFTPSQIEQMVILNSESAQSSTK